LNGHAATPQNGHTLGPTAGPPTPPPTQTGRNGRNTRRRTSRVPTAVRSPGRQPLTGRQAGEPTDSAAPAATDRASSATRTRPTLGGLRQPSGRRRACAPAHRTPWPSCKVRPAYVVVLTASAVGCRACSPRKPPPRAGSPYVVCECWHSANQEKVCRSGRRAALPVPLAGATVQHHPHRGKEPATNLSAGKAIGRRKGLPGLPPPSRHHRVTNRHGHHVAGH